MCRLLVIFALRLVESDKCLGRVEQCMKCQLKYLRADPLQFLQLFRSLHGKYRKQYLSQNVAFCTIFYNFYLIAMLNA